MLPSLRHLLHSQGAKALKDLDAQVELDAGIAVHPPVLAAGTKKRSALRTAPPAVQVTAASDLEASTEEVSTLHFAIVYLMTHNPPFSLQQHSGSNSLYIGCIQSYSWHGMFPVPIISSKTTICACRSSPATTHGLTRSRTTSRMATRARTS